MRHSTAKPLLLKYHAAQFSDSPVKILPCNNWVQTRAYPADTPTIPNVARIRPAFVPSTAKHPARTLRKSSRQQHYAAEVRNLLAEVLPGSSRIMTSTYPADTTTLLNIVRPWHTFVPAGAPAEMRRQGSQPFRLKHYAARSYSASVSGLAFAVWTGLAGCGADEGFRGCIGRGGWRHAGQGC